MSAVRSWTSAFAASVLVAATAAARPLPGSMKTRPVGDVASGQWRNATVDGKTVAVELDMGTKRVNWNHAKWAVLDLARPADLSAWDGLLVTVVYNDGGRYVRSRRREGRQRLPAVHGLGGDGAMNGPRAEGERRA